MGTKQKENQKILIKTILEDFLLMLLFKELEDCLFLVLTTLLLMILMTQSTTMSIAKLEETVTQNIFFDD